MNKPYRYQQGFTLIELVVVIIVLGILAATVIPKFINIQNDAKMESLRSVKAAMQGAVNLVYSKSVIKGNEKLTAGADVYVNINGSPVSIKYATPRANYEGSWDDLITLDDNIFSTTIVGGYFL
ncbi:MAG: MSHA pilin protein MshA [Moritella dasanensis]|jgi:MSHA pilin protein MshA